MKSDDKSKLEQLELLTAKDTLRKMKKKQNGKCITLRLRKVKAVCQIIVCRNLWYNVDRKIKPEVRFVGRGGGYGGGWTIASEKMVTIRGAAVCDTCCERMVMQGEEQKKKKGNKRC